MREELLTTDIDIPRFACFLCRRRAAAPSAIAECFRPRHLLISRFPPQICFNSTEPPSRRTDIYTRHQPPRAFAFAIIFAILSFSRFLLLLLPPSRRPPRCRFLASSFRCFSRRFVIAACYHPKFRRCCRRATVAFLISLRRHDCLSCYAPPPLFDLSFSLHFTPQRRRHRQGWVIAQSIATIQCTIANIG